MTEPRPRHRARGQFFATPDLQDLLYAFGDNPHTPTSTNPNTGNPGQTNTTSSSLPTTITTLSEILEAFLTSTCHSAALSASYSRRAKIKVDDFKYVLREDEVLLGRALEQMWKDRGLKEERRMMDLEKGGAQGKGGLEELGVLAEVGGEAEGGKVGRGRGRKRKGGAVGGEGGGGKRVKEG
ncbi:hypothetical protein B0A50_05698 [Salinomyces thailandicus]|uniref:Transcription initiation factor TFIID subunit 13 n=1 Tax=Salinomyces thailandicus TaxID=706561 RepID=A0A4U0TRF5_9PEZI|nr:hypothetical protein B0A50_05698 [Salinomyces thailandica]